MTRGNTRQRIQEIALELFTERGYEKTSLREIAEHLGVTKAALYYHFKTKEDIVVSLFEDIAKPCDELIEWASDRPRDLETKLEVLRRYSEALRQAEPLMRFMQENQATMRELSIGESFKGRMLKLLDVIRLPEAGVSDQVRCSAALFTMHAGMFATQNIEAGPEEKRRAVLEVAQELLVSAHRGADGKE